MNHGAMIAIHAAAAAAKARTEVLDAFRVNGATAPERARGLHELALADDNSALRAFFESGVLRAVDSRGRALVPGGRAGAGDRYYLDEQALIADRDGNSGSAKRRQVMLIALGAGFLLAGLIVGLLRVRAG
jgi:hypothetical protein